MSIVERVRGVRCRRIGDDVVAGGEGASDLERGRWCLALARRPLPDPSSSCVASPRSRSPATPTT
jgi:hypothetical protein